MLSRYIKFIIFFAASSFLFSCKNSSDASYDNENPSYTVYDNDLKITSTTVTQETMTDINGNDFALLKIQFTVSKPFTLIKIKNPITGETKESKNSDSKSQASIQTDTDFDKKFSIIVTPFNDDVEGLSYTFGFTPQKRNGTYTETNPDFRCLTFD